MVQVHLAPPARAHLLTAAEDWPAVVQRADVRGCRGGRDLLRALSGAARPARRCAFGAADAAEPTAVLVLLQLGATGMQASVLSRLCLGH